jgi:hypothetical protein
VKLQLTDLGIGGDFHLDNVRARVHEPDRPLLQTPRRATTPARRADSGILPTPIAISPRPTAATTSTCSTASTSMPASSSPTSACSRYYQFDNWAYQPSYVSSNTPWFFNGVRVQWFPTAKLKIEPWFINGWQSYGGSTIGLGSADRSCIGPTASWRFIGNQYGYGEDALGIPSRTRYHTDDSIEYKYYDRPTPSSAKLP